MIEERFKTILSKFEDVYDSIRQLLNSDSDLIVYGTGENARKVAGYIDKHTANVKYFCDRNINKNNKCSGVEIVDIQAAVNSGLPIVVAATMYGEIIPKLKEEGAQSLFNLSLIGLAKEPMVDNVAERLTWLFKRLEDDESKLVLINILSFLSDDQLQTIPVSLYPQYRHNKVYFRRPLKMIDGGACRGEVFDEFSDYMQAENEYLLLEPALENVSYIENKRQIYPAKTTVLPLGLWSSKKSLYFSSPEQSGAHYNCAISVAGDIEIKVIGLDELCAEFNFVPNFIKMDIEGAEVEALKSSVKTIKKHSPKLAICLYHDLDDLWNIPAFLHGQNNQYKMYIGHHQSGWFETVLYCDYT